MKADKCLEWLKRSLLLRLQISKTLLCIQRLPPLEPITLLQYWIGARRLICLCRVTREGISLDSNFAKIAELPGVAAPGPHRFARVLGRGMKADRCLEWLERALLTLLI